ncbi:MAG TPA: cation:proton antiporter [bacterium]|nr:cation:proton antiporter [bacterium]
MEHTLQLLLILTIILVFAKAAGALAVRFGQPDVFGKILAGFILGPTVLNILGWKIFADGHAAPGMLMNTLRDLGSIGVVLLMFIAGLETDLKGLLKVGKVAFWAAFGGVVLPMAAGTAISRYFGYGWQESVFIGTILTATSVSITAQTLLELNALKSKEGSAILGAAVIDDVMGIIALSLVVGFVLASGSTAGAASAGSAASIILLLIRMGLFFAVSIFIGTRYFEKYLKLAAKVPAGHIVFAAALAVMFFYAWAAEYAGKVANITGAYIAGVLLARTSFRGKIIHEAQLFSYSFFVTIFLVNLGLVADARTLGGSVAFVTLIIAIAIITKIVGCGAGAFLTGFNFRESLRVGVGMISRGEVGLIIASYGLSHGVIDNAIFSDTILMVMATTLVTPVLLRFVFPTKRLMPV